MCTNILQLKRTLALVAFLKNEIKISSPRNKNYNLPLNLEGIDIREGKLGAI